MFFQRHVSALLPLVESGDLPAAAHARVNRHLACCARCRQELADIRFAADVMRRIALVPAPDSVWLGLNAALDRRTTRQTRRVTGAGARWPLPAGWRWPAVAAAAAAAALLLSIYALYSTRSAPADGRWAVTGPGSSAATTGDWVETAADARAHIKVGSIGTVDVEPSSRVRLAAASETEYRLQLTRGTIRARILAPPRLFIVDTPATTVVDLGCAYSVTVGEDGSGEIVVTEGWTALESPGRESLVPAGAFCRIRPGEGPGTPYFTDAPARMRQAVEAFDAGNEDAPTVQGLLAAARTRDTLTLWHLVSRVNPDLRPLVVDRIDELVPPPGGVVRERILSLDPDTLRLWREELAWKW
jgi:anti-sigma factor RsiW